MRPREAIRISILTTLVLWFTGFVVVPFSNTGAREFLTAIGFSGPKFEWWSYQVENLVYTVGRIPLMFAAYVAFSGSCDLQKSENRLAYMVMILGAAVTILCSGWPQMAGFVLVVSGLIVRMSVALNGLKNAAE